MVPDHAEALVDKYLADCPFADTIQDSGTELPESLQPEGYEAACAALASSRAMLESAGDLAKGQEDPDEAFLKSLELSVMAAQRKVREKVSAEEAFREVPQCSKKRKPDVDVSVRWTKSRVKEAQAMAAAMRIKKGGNSLLLDNTAKIGLSDDLKGGRLLKFLSELSCIHKAVSIWNANVPDE